MAQPAPRPGILEVQAYVGGKAATAAGARAAKLSANESAIGPSPRAIEAYRGVAGELHRYPDGGAVRLRQAIGRRFNLDPERVVCGAGSDELIALLVRAYAGPGEEVIHTEHGFGMYRIAALAAGAHAVAVPETARRADVDALLAAVTSRTRIVFLANPNNPTGSYLSGTELRRLRAGLPEHVLLVIDGAYAEFVDAEDYESGLALAQEAANVVATRTFSKLFGLAALRVGWLYGDPAVVDVVNRIRGPFNVATPAQAAAEAALADIDHQAAAKAHNDRWLPWLTAGIAASGLVVWPSVGNFFLVDFPDEPGRDATAAATWLEGRGLIPRMMAAYGLPGSLRISVGSEEENERLVAALADFVARS